jgi:hypothetical protein
MTIAILPFAARSICFAASLSLLAACSAQDEVSRQAEAPAETETPPQGSANPVPVETPEPEAGDSPESPDQPVSGTADSPTVGGDGSPIRLGTLSEAEVLNADLPGELGCSFSLTQTGAASLVISADVADDARGSGVYKHAGYVERIVTPYTGGFGALEKRRAFGGKGMTMKVETPGNVTVRGGESPLYRAQLVMQRADGAERSVPGFWTCGP